MCKRLMRGVMMLAMLAGLLPGLSGCEELAIEQSSGRRQPSAPAIDYGMRGGLEVPFNIPL